MVASDIGLHRYAFGTHGRHVVQGADWLALLCFEKLIISPRLQIFSTNMTDTVKYLSTALVNVSLVSSASHQT